MSEVANYSYVHVPLELIVSDKSPWSDTEKIYAILVHAGRKVDYGTLGRIIGKDVKQVKECCVKLVRAGRIIRMASGTKQHGTAQLAVTGLPDVDPDGQQLATFRGLMYKVHPKGARPSPLKTRLVGSAKSDGCRLSVKLTDAEFEFLNKHKAFTQLSNWSRDLPKYCLAAELTAFMQFKLNNCDMFGGTAADWALIYCVQGVVGYANAGHTIGNPIGWIRKLLPDWRKESCGIRPHPFDNTNRSGLPSLAKRLGFELEESATGVTNHLSVVTPMTIKKVV